MNYVDVGQANEQADQLGNHARVVHGMGENLVRCRNNLGANWQADEMATINQAIGQIILTLNSIANDLNAIGDDIRARAPEVLRQQQLVTERANLRNANATLHSVNAELRNAIAQRDRLQQQLGADRNDPRLNLANCGVAAARSRVDAARQAHNTAQNRVRALT